MIEPLFNCDPQDPNGPACEFPPLTDEMVTAAEEALGVTLPSAYVELMRTCNGGYVDAGFRTDHPTKAFNNHVPVYEIRGIPPVGAVDQHGLPEGIVCSNYLVEEWGLPKNLVLFSGEGHWWVAMDYRKSGPAGPPTVAWLFTDLDEDFQLAESFEAFLEGLVPDSEVPDD